MVQALSKGVIVKSPCMLRMLKAISMADSCSCQLVLLEKKRNYALQRQFNEKSGVIPGCSGNGAATWWHQATDCKCVMLNDTLLLPQLVRSLCTHVLPHSQAQSRIAALISTSHEVLIWQPANKQQHVLWTQSDRTSSRQPMCS